MAGKILRANDIPAGNEAKAIIEIDGKLQEIFYAKSVEAKLELNKVDVKVLGSRITQKRVSGSEATGSMTIYYVTSVFRQMAQRYDKEGIMPTFKLIVTNDDKGTSIGKQTVVLYDCMIDATIITKFNVEDDILDEDIDFTYGAFDILESFVEPTYTV